LRQYSGRLQIPEQAWERRRISRLEQYATLNGFEHPVLEFGVTPARGTLLRLDRAFCGFFRRVAHGQTPGYPRFRAARRFDSVEYPDNHSWKMEQNRLYLQGVRHIRFFCSKRGVVGTPKTLVLKREGRRLRAYVASEIVQIEPKPRTGAVVGLDLGITYLDATSDGQLIENPRFTDAMAERLAQAERLVQGRTNGSHRRRKAVLALAEQHRRVARRRRHHLHKVSKDLVDRHDLIAHEDLAIANLVKRPKPCPDGDGGFLPNGASAKSGLNKQISSAGWGVLVSMLSYKAEWAGTTLVAVDPRHTSQRCHCCGHVAEENRKREKFACVACGHHDHADVNAAKNVLVGQAWPVTLCEKHPFWCKAQSPSPYSEAVLARAPASAANLGPGFDTLGLALDRYVEVEVEPAPRLIVRSEGEGAGISDDAGHLAARVAMEVIGHDRIAITVRSQIPVARGLGSSAALAVAAAAAAGSKDPLAVAARVDGHGDNAAASFIGGLVAATTVKGSVVAVKLNLDPTLVFVTIVPDRSIPTAKARQVLPAQINREDAAFNLGRMGMLLVGLADHRLLTRVAAEDRLHQDYRSPLFPEAPKLLSGLVASGALASCWSGAGPSLLGICADHDAARIRQAAIALMADAGVPGRVLILRADMTGLVTGDSARLPPIDAGESSRWDVFGVDDAEPRLETRLGASEFRDEGPTGLFDFDEHG
jgi:putative transposase